MAALFLAMVTVPAVSAEGDKNIEDTNRQLVDYFNSPAFAEGKALDSFVPYEISDEKSKTELNKENSVGIRHIAIKVGSDDKDVENVYNYVKGKSDRVLAIYTGQCLTHVAYERMSIYLAENWGFNVYIIERREVNVAREDDANSLMEFWTEKITLRDYAIGNAFTRIDIGRENNIDPAAVRLVTVGHSLGATLATKFEASSYDQGLSASDYLVSVDTIIQFDPADPQYNELKQRQVYHCIDLAGARSSLNFAITDMQGMIDMAEAALNRHNEKCAVQPLAKMGIDALTNIHVFRLAAGETHQSMSWPFNDQYSYCGMGTFQFYSPLAYVNEHDLLVMITSGGAVCSSPIYLEQGMDATMAENEIIDETQFDGLHSTYIGIKGGFGPYGAYWYGKQGGKTIEWGEEGEGHGDIFMDNNAPALWDIIAQEAMN